VRNFGPINKSGGEKRLNVAFSRAKYHMALVSSIQYTDIKNEYNDGANCLKNYLRYAAAVSAGNRDATARVLHDVVVWKDEDSRGEQSRTDAVTKQLAAALQGRGYLVDLAVGQSHFRCDIAVRRPGDNAYGLGILVDNQQHYEQTDLLERDMMRPKLLRAFGWQVAHVLAKDWYADRDGTLDRLERMVRGEAEEAEDDDADSVPDFPIHGAPEPGAGGEAVEDQHRPVPGGDDVTAQATPFGDLQPVDPKEQPNAKDEPAALQHSSTPTFRHLVVRE